VASKQRRRKSSGSAAARSRRRTGVEQRLDYRDAPLIPDSVLKKPGKLTEEEFDVMKSHTVIGYGLLKNSTRIILKSAAILAHEHHEKWNGKGYPQGLKGEEIHIYGRITAIADVFDALGSERVYKAAWELDRILNLFTEEKGHHFDPQIVDAFMEQLPKIIHVRDNYSDIV